MDGVAAPHMERKALQARPELSSFILLALSAAAVLLVGCASSRSAIRADADPSIDFSNFESYGFPDELGTDRAGYSTLITSYFRDGVHREMRSRGYTYTEVNPDLLVNFFANIRDITAIRPRPNAWLACGYYGYRYGMYRAWPGYGERADAVQCKSGTVNIDVVDAGRNQLIWEGRAEGRLTPALMQNPHPAIDSVVGELFDRYPGRVTPEDHE
jgi:hypothetical protein